MKIIYLPARDIAAGKTRGQGPGVRFSKVLVTFSDVAHHGDFMAGKRGTPDIVLFSHTFLLLF